LSMIKRNPKLIIISVLLVLSFAVALYLRINLPFDRVFSDVGIKYTSADAYYNISLADNLAHNFPHHMTIDPYRVFPGEPAGVLYGFIAWLIAVPAWIIGLGSPTQLHVDLVGVYLPAILGGLTVFPVFFIGKELFNRWVGIMAAGLIAILPGEFLGRSILGFTDYHVAEALFTATTMLFLILAVKSASQQELTFNHLKQWDWGMIKKPFIYSLLASLFMGIYIFTWLGALLFAFIVALYFILQFTIDHLKGKDTDYLSCTVFVFFLVTLVICEYDYEIGFGFACAWVSPCI